MRRQTARKTPKPLLVLNTACNKYRPKPHRCNESQNPPSGPQSERACGECCGMRFALWPQTHAEVTLFRPLDAPHGMWPVEQHERSDAANPGHPHRQAESESYAPGQQRCRNRDSAHQREPCQPQSGRKARGVQVNSKAIRDTGRRVWGRWGHRLPADSVRYQGRAIREIRRTPRVRHLPPGRDDREDTAGAGSRVPSCRGGSAIAICRVRRPISADAPASSS